MTEKFIDALNKAQREVDAANDAADDAAEASEDAEKVAVEAKINKMARELELEVRQKEIAEEEQRASRPMTEIRADEADNFWQRVGRLLKRGKP